MKYTVHHSDTGLSLLESHTIALTGGHDQESFIYDNDMTHNIILFDNIAIKVVEKNKKLYTVIDIGARKLYAFKEWANCTCTKIEVTEHNKDIVKNGCIKKNGNDLHIYHQKYRSMSYQSTTLHIQDYDPQLRCIYCECIFMLPFPDFRLELNGKYIEPYPQECITDLKLDILDVMARCRHPESVDNKDNKDNKGKSE